MKGIPNRKETSSKAQRKANKGTRGGGHYKGHSMECKVSPREVSKEVLCLSFGCWLKGFIYTEKNKRATSRYYYMIQIILLKKTNTKTGLNTFFRLPLSKLWVHQVGGAVLITVFIFMILNRFRKIKCNWEFIAFG